MKFIYTCLCTLLLSATTFATTWNVTVANFSFSPSTINAVVGDVIHFAWASGIHTTTCGSGLPGTTLPAGAAEWDADMTTSAREFSYTLTATGNYFYGCVPHFAAGAGMVGTLVVSGTVPVALGMFDVARANNTVTVSWKTFTESNTSHFSIRRSTDGTKFQEIGKVTAAGNSSSTLSYTFSDINPARYKYLYYELVTVDIDGKESYSDIKLIKNLSGPDKLIVALSPNPITRPGQMQIQFNAERDGSMDVKVYNMNGKLVLKEKMAAFYGLNNAHLHVCDLQKGVYTIQFELDHVKEVKKILVN